jgi:uncharacterized protein YkwD
VPPHAQVTHTGRSAASAPPAAAGPCSGGGLLPTEADLEAVRAAALCLVNRERAANGAGALTLNEDLDRAAREHSESMAAGGYFEHTAPGGDGFLRRLQDFGYLTSTRVLYNVGENIAWGSLQDATPASVVAAWMASPGHRANMLNPEFRDIGIGIVPRLPSSLGAGASGAMYTEDFGVVL